MGFISAIKRWWNNLFNKKNIQEAFGVESFAISDLMLSKQDHYRRIMKGRADWNDKDTPSLMLASVVVNETVDEVLNDFKTEIIVPGAEQTNPRTAFLNKQYLDYVENGLEETVTNFLSEGETILKPYMTAAGVDVGVYSTDFYAPLAYNARHWLTDVVFVAKATKQGDAKHVYKLFERHTWDEAAQMHSIEYKAYKSETSNFGRIGAESSGMPVPLTEIPEWTHLADVAIGNMERPLFVHIRNKAKFKLESPQLQGLPIFAKAVESGSLEKLDRQEARTEWEFEGGELSVDAPVSWFRRDEQGNVMLPEGKKRLFRTHENRNDSPSEKAETFSPTLRIEEHGARLNQLRRDVELQTGMAYGIISDNNQVEKTAEEFRSSKKRLINTVMQTQKITGVAIDALVYSWDKLVDIHAGLNIPMGDFEVVKQWNESLAADRPREFEERKQAQSMGWIEDYKNYAWFQDLDEETAKAAVAEMRQAQDEFEP